MAAVDRVQERRKAAALARRYRDQEGLSIAEIARKLGRPKSTVKAYLYDPSDDNKRPKMARGSDSSRRSPLMHGRRICKPPARLSLRRHDAGVADSQFVRGVSSVVIAVPVAAPNFVNPQVAQISPLVIELVTLHRWLQVGVGDTPAPLLVADTSG
jgi:hypothetical protein